MRALAATCFRRCPYNSVAEQLRSFFISPTIPPSSPPDSCGNKGEEKRTDMETQAGDTSNQENVEKHRGAEDLQEDPTRHIEESERDEVVQNRKVVDLVSDDSTFDDVPIGELMASLRQTDSDDIVKKEQADNDKNNPKDSSLREIIESVKGSSKPGAKSHETRVSAHDENDAEEDSDDRTTHETSTEIENELASICSPTNENEDKEDRSKPFSDGAQDASRHEAESRETGVSEHDEIAAEEGSHHDRGTNKTSTETEAEVASTPMNENEDKEGRSKPLSDRSSNSSPIALGTRDNDLSPCPPGKGPTGKRDGHRNVFVPKSRMTEKSREVGRRISSNRKRNAHGLYPCPCGGPRPAGMKWDRHRGIFVPRPPTQTNSIATRDSSKEHDGFDEKDSQASDGKDKSRHKKRNPRPGEENDTKRSKKAHATASSGSETTPQKPRELGTAIGSRVYACYPGNNFWYWGVIVDVKRKKCSHFDQYSILFDDGDFEEYLSRSRFLTIFQHREKPPKFPKMTATKLRYFLGSKADDILSSSPSDGHSPMTLEQLLQNACGECMNCQKPDCRQCAGCISNRSQVCIQKMCCKIPVENKAQPMPISARFPKGWRYVIDPTMPNFVSKEKEKQMQKLGVVGLKLLPPPTAGKLTFYSVERAKGKMPILLAKVSPEAFYQHIGTMRSPLAPSASGKSGTRGNRACGTCENCTRNACGKCARCKSGSISCLQKLCLNIKPELVAEPAVGFPEGYCFFFRKGDKDRFPHVMILSGGGREFTFEGALRFCHLDDPDDVSRKFNEYVGLFSDENLPHRQNQGSARRLHHAPRKPALLRKGIDIQAEFEDSESDDDNEDEFTQDSRVTTSTDDFLIGRKYSFTWTDLRGQKKVVYGKVTECKIENESGEVNSYKVEYNDKSRTLANALQNGCGSAVPEFQWIEPPMAIGGCVGYDEHTSTSADRLIATKLPFYTTWITPDARHEVVSNGLPQLTLAVRGYELTFKVKRSTIPNAGNGVFLSCSQMFDDDQLPFELKCGELLDMGSYAPLRIGDRRSEPVMYVKSFIHSARCEEFAFDQKGSTDQLDITDDITGMLHAKAKRSIQAYVNESNEKDDICIWAEHDAEDSVHYLLGHANQSQGAFRLSCDSCEQEVFINYGPLYEKVRVRKGYSFLSEDEQVDILEELRDEDVRDVLEMGMFSEMEVHKATNFLFLLFTEEPRSKFTDPLVIERALLCTAILQRTARRFFVDKDSDATTCQDNLTNTCKMLRKLVFVLLGMLNDEQGELHALEAGGHFDELLRKILERQYSEEQLSKLGDFL